MHLFWLRKTKFATKFLHMVEFWEKGTLRFRYNYYTIYASVFTVLKTMI